MKTTVVQTIEKKKAQLLQKRWVLSGMFTLMAIASGFSQETIDGKINEWKETLQTALNAGVGAFAIVGGFIVFLQYMQGNDQAQKNFVKFVIGLAIFGLVNVIAGVFLTDTGVTVTT